MAFQDFDYISERRKNEQKQKAKNRIMIGVVLFLAVLVLIAAAACAYVYINRNSAADGKTGKHSTNHPNPAKDKAAHAKDDGNAATLKAVKMLCSSTDYIQTCQDSLSKYIGSNATASKQPKDLLQAAISVVSAELQKVYDKVSTMNFDTPELKGAFEDCKVLFQDAKDELNSSVSSVHQQTTTSLSSSTPDLNNWLSAVMSYQETCIDGFPDGDVKTSMNTSLQSVKELTSNSLAIVNQVSGLFSAVNFGASRRLLDHDGLPSWMSDEDRRMLKRKDKSKDKSLVPNVTVALDGSGQFKTISDALAAMPTAYEGRYNIYVKEGIYQEYPIVSKNMINVTIYGDGSQKSVVTGNKNFVDGVRTFQTATFTVLGDGFMAQSIGFKNTAGGEKHQAVAIRVQADRSVFLNCRMEGYQDTVYAQTHRQFYRGCLITGTVDFIFGDAASIFQNCVMYIMKPLDNQQTIVTAQGRIDKRETTGIVLQNCKILADKGFEEDKMKFKNYLGRPWKEYSRTIVMESEIGELIDPAGWMPWEGDFALNTLYYAEYANTGPGAKTDSRVKWAGYKGIISKTEAQKYTVTPFLQGDTWLDSNTKVRFGLSS
ncbi:pectinesterase-like [Impatiens glandulifera]|uniref:pectinesterase-like n=1 Tax=Impatiens glandulifera TaxID=253017 RepID=UPI001FB14206|nr:pectinesterase-like [Impatiens glandulifera]